ncbi:hypothetical protein EI42_04708 [Thermosporothrix hazakensis]|jgi:hypothetical protein|uniref:Uncharacterized protein n=1 Tax=Thermosporothrix hazakensis TaxID=644383 RepID=A0A326U200_THEHA|nr:hypothetical protein [Thermosporothrix hazakensis]PZW24017.1 hypothetical protein EI42_04708 [Thermosporothrix hazakensis]GCE50233.1 hypothetical protein KTH_51020 [Thermosporothrix hazakensis]
MYRSSCSCPVDGHDDMIQKVSGIIDQETVNTSGSTFYAGRAYHDNRTKSDISMTGFSSSTSQSSLAQMLSFPPLDVTMYNLFLFLSWGAGIPLLVFGGPCVCSSGNGAAMLFMLLLLGGVILAIVMLEKKKRQYLQKWQPHWARARYVWESLYYCRRHHIVFVPETGEYAPAGQTKRFIFDAQPPSQRM